MKIYNRKKFMFSCIFFTLSMLIFGKSVNLLNEGNSMNIVSSPVVKATDRRTNDNKLIRGKNLNKNHYIILDAGHGGIDKGASYGEMDEKDVTLKIVKYAEVYLKSKGYTVFLTRDEDKLLSLTEIGDKVNSSYSDVFVSIHVNSLKDKEFKGITTFNYDVNGYQKEERIKLANIIQKEAVKSDNWESKGIKTQNLAVLRYSKIPCVLVECGFITNEEDRKKLSREEVLKRLAENISNGIIKYLDESSDSGYNSNDK